MLNPSQIKHLIKSILLGQLLAVFLSSCTIFQVLLLEIKPAIHAALFCTELMYHCVLLTSCILAYKLNLVSFLKKQPTRMFVAYMCMGIADFMANFTLLRSFESGTSAISIVLVTSFGSVIAMILSIFILRHRYDRIHILGSVIILSGIAVINYNKFISSKDHFVEFYGLFLALASSVGFAISNVTQEYCSMKEKGYPIASLFSMGFIGSLISLPFTNFTEIGISDRSSLLDNENSIKWVFSMGYILSTCCFYFMAPWYMRKFSAVSLSFSTLTCDIYIFIFSLTYTKVTMTPLYLCGFFMIMVGLLVFHTGKVTINGVEKMEIDFEKEPDQENPDVSVDVDGRLVGLR